MYRVLTLLLFFCTIAWHLTGQTIDSLKQLLNQPSLDMLEQITVRQQLSKHYERSNQDSALYFIEAAENRFENYRNDSLFLRVITQKAQLLVTLQKMDEAKEVLDKIEALIGKDSTSMLYTNVLFQRGNIHLFQQQFDQALNFYLKGLGFLNEQTEPLEALRFYNNISITYIQLKKPKEAQVYLEKAVELHQEPDQLRLSLLSNLAALYQENQAEVRALEVLAEAEQLALALDHQPFLAKQYTNFSSVYLKLNQLDQAIDYAQKSLDIKQKNQLPGIALALNNLGYAHFLKEQYQKAADIFQEALPLAIGSEQLQILLNLKNAYQALNQPTKSLQYFDAYNLLKDSINAQDYEQKVAEISEKYEAEKKEQQIQLLQADNELQNARISRQRFLMAAVGLFFFLLFAVGYLLMRQNKIRQTLYYTNGFYACS